MSDYIELKTFKRLSEDKIVLDGIIWTTDPDKWMPIKNNETGHMLHSVKVGDTYYYPMMIDARRNK